MNPRVSVAIAVCVALILCACSPAPQNLIVGRWEVEGTPMKMTAEFSPDGKAKITMLGQTLRGTYRLSPDNELEWNMNGITSKSKAHVTATELELTDAANRTIKYKRM